MTLVRSGNDVTVEIAESTPGAGDSGSVLLKNSLDDYYGQGVESIAFADGTVWSRAQIRQRLLQAAGTPGNDTITGFNTNDTLAGNAGDDTYLYARGDGHDTISEATWNGNNDRLVLLPGTVAGVSADSIEASDPAKPGSQGHSGPDSGSSDQPNVPAKQYLYSAEVSLDRPSMLIDGSEVAIRPGLAVTVEIKTGSRRVLSYLLSPLARYAHESLREH